MEKLLRYLPFHFLCCLVTGIFLQFRYQVWQSNFQNLAILFVVFLLLLALLHYYKKKFTFGLLTLIFFVFMGVSSVFTQDDRNYKSYYNFFVSKDFTTVLTIYKILKPGNYYHKYEAEVSQINKKKTIGRILLNIQKDSLQENLKVDDRIFLKPAFKELIPPLNPHQFSYKEYLAKQGIYRQVSVNNQQFKVIDKRFFSLIGFSARFRSKIQQSLKKYNFKQDEYAVISALLLGQRQDISKELIEDYSRAGAIHILAVSGLHIGVILLLLNLLFKKLNKTRKGTIFKAILIITLLWIFAFIAGLSASVVRAVAMFTFVAVGQSFKRKRIVEHSLIASMFFLLLIKPVFLFNVGFQLSYLAVFGIVWVQPLLYNLWKPKLNFLDKGWRLFTVSVAAQVGILPISLFYFHQFPSLFILSNLVIIPFLSIILLGGIIVMLLAVIGILPQFLADAYGFIISLMNRFISWVSHQEDFLFRELSMSFLQMIFWYVVIMLIFRFFIKKRPKRLILALISIIFIQLLYVFDDFQKNNKQEFIVFHKSRKSVLGVRNGTKFTVLHDLDSAKIQQEKLLISYRIGAGIQSKYVTKTPNVFQFNNETILRIDSLGVYQINQLKNPIVLLQYSPKINLKRLLYILKPSQIIADGTNYKSYINRWKETCKKQKTPFHYTGKNGVYILNSSGNEE